VFFLENKHPVNSNIFIYSTVLGRCGTTEKQCCKTDEKTEVQAKNIWTNSYPAFFGYDFAKKILKLSHNAMNRNMLFMKKGFGIAKETRGEVPSLSANYLRAF